MIGILAIAIVATRSVAIKKGIGVMDVSFDGFWSVSLLCAWLAGEYFHHYARLPRISIYVSAGVILAMLQPDLTAFSLFEEALIFLVNVAFCLILFEFGYRINLFWLRANPWIAVTGFTETLCTFFAVYVLAQWWGVSVTMTWLLAALAISTSPAEILRVVNEQHSAGQVTERILHLSAINCTLAIFALNAVLGLAIFENSGNAWQAVYQSLIVLLASGAIGVLLGMVMPLLLFLLRGVKQQGHTVAFAIAILFLVTLTRALALSPALAALALGLITRHRRISINRVEQSFGTLGHLLSVLLFVFLSTLFTWENMVAGVGLGLALIVVRGLAKIVAIGIYARISGISWTKGVLVGVAMAPFSVFAILLAWQTGLQINSTEQFAPFIFAACVLGIVGPILTQCALIGAHENRSKES